LHSPDALFETAFKFVKSQVYKSVENTITPTPALQFFLPLQLHSIKHNSPFYEVRTHFRKYLVWAETGDVLLFEQDPPHMPDRRKNKTLGSRY
jgi:hypothetical protein